MLPLLVVDPHLPEEVRRALQDSKAEGVRALMRMGLSCGDALELIGLEPRAALRDACI